jgi:hypothetical protein
VKTDLDLCTSDGCGSGDEIRGYGSTYTVTFLTIQTENPVIEVVNVVYLGGPVYIDGNLDAANPTNTFKYTLIDTVITVRKGEYIAVPLIGGYGKNVVPPSGSDSSGLLPGENPWLTPSWVMLFNESFTPPPEDLQKSLDVAIWTYYLDKIDTVAQIILTKRLDASALRIQRVGYGSLSLAEVEVFAEGLNVLSRYEAQSDVEPSPLTRPYQAGMFPTLKILIFSCY